MIFSDIKKEAVNYEVATGIKPTRVYLGVNQRCELVMAMIEHHPEMCATERIVHRENIFEVMGLRIFNVSETDHLFVA